MSTAIVTPKRPLRAAMREVAGRVRRRGRWWIAGTLGALLVVLWSLPMVVAHSPLRNAILASVCRDIDGTVTAEGATLGWFSSVRLSDVVVADRDGNPVLELPSVESQASLRALMVDMQHPGHFLLKQPRVFVRLTEDGSNIEDVLATLLAKEPSQELASPEISVEVIGGTATVEDVAAGRTWELADVAGLLKLGHNWSAPLRLQLSAAARHAGGAGTLKVDATVEATAHEGAAPDSRGQVTLNGDALPLELLEPLLRRAQPDGHLAGTLSTELHCEWTREAGALTLAFVEGDVSAKPLVLHAPGIVPDELRLDELRIPCRVTWRPEGLLVDHASLTCEAGTLSVDGPLKLRLDQAPAAETIAALFRDAYRIEGKLDVARLAKIAPRALRIREGTNVTSGQLSLSLVHQSAADGGAWEGQAEMSGIAAENQGRAISWEKPVLVTLSAREGAEGPAIDKLTWRSEFLDAEASGTLDALSGWATCDLNKLAEQLGQFVDLGDWQLGGEGWTYFNLRRKESGDFDVDGEFQIEKLTLGTPGEGQWVEENLIGSLAVTGHAEGQTLHQVATGMLKVESGSDAGSLKLLRPVAGATTADAWPIELQVRGQLATWVARIEAWTGPLAGWDIAGVADVAAQITASTGRVQVDSARATLRQLRVAGGGLVIDEPSVEATLVGQWDASAGRGNITEAVLSSSALGLRATDVACVLRDGRLAELSGGLTYSAELSRVQRWTYAASAPPAWQLAGRMRGEADFGREEQRVTGRLTAVIDNLQATGAENRSWSERHVELSVNGSYDPALDLLVLDQAKLDADTARIAAEGQAASLTDAPDLKLKGQFDYDPEQVLALLRPYLGEGVEISAERSARPFALAGHATPAGLGLAAKSPSEPSDEAESETQAVKPLLASASVGWTGANLYGFPIGAAEFRGKFREGTITVAPLDLAVSEGRLTASPSVRLWPGEAELTLPPGPLLSQVRITPEMCQAGLKYVLPILADVGQAEGHFSMELAACRIPLSAPETADVSGTLTVNDIQAAAGPMLRELVYIADTVRRLALGKNLRPAGSGLSPVKLTRKSTVTFRLVDGRVYHRDLELTFDDVVIRTHGSVGLDQSLELVAEMPVPDKWIGNNLAGSALRGQTLQLPLAGTLSAPQVDERALKEITSQFVQRGAQGLIREGLNQGLDRLLGPKR